MSSEIELRKWLNRANKSFITNVQFGIKAWNSIEFVLITKHDIITEEFCNNLPKLQTELKSIDNYTEAWTIINEFLALKYSPGAVGSSIKKKLIYALQRETAYTLNNPIQKVFEGLLLTLHSPSLQSYYKSNGKVYANFIATCLSYLNCLLTQTHVPTWMKNHEEAVTGIIVGIKTYAKQTPFLEIFQKACTQKVLVPLSELIIILKQNSVDISNAFFGILQELYFNSIKSEILKSSLVERKENEFSQLFNTPTHTFLMISESFIVSFNHDVHQQANFLKYLFEYYFEIGNKFESNADLLNCLAYLMHLLKQHDFQLNYEINNVKAIAYIGKNIEQIVDMHYETNLNETINLLCATLRLNPMILEQSIFSIVVKCMVTRKEESSMETFAEFMCLVIDLFRRLNRAEKFISRLIRSLWDKLSTIKLSKKLKRKSIIAPSKPTKKLKIVNGSDVENGNTNDEINVSKKYMNVLLSSLLPTVVKSENKQLETWPYITFAWPQRVGDTFSKLISGLISKPSLVVWKTLIFTLTDYIQVLKTGKSDENTLFFIDIASALLSQYFLGSRLAEQSDKTWDLIEANRGLTHTVLKEFGTAILNQEHNIRTMNAFLKVCYSASNFDLLCYYYCPDSYNISENSKYPHLPVLDLIAYSDNIHSYLLPQEWTLIEQRITNFGKYECRENINKLYLQKIKSALLFKNKKNVNIHNDVVSLLNNLEQITAILTDDTTNSWFINLLNREEKILVCELILASDKPFEVVKHCLQNTEFLEVLVLSIFKHISNCFNSSSSIFKTIDFVKVLALDKTVHKEIAKTLRKFISEDVVIKKYSSESLNANLHFLEQLPLECIRYDAKNIIFLINLALYCNIKATRNENELMNSCLSLVRVFLHFGETPDIFTNLTIMDLHKIFLNDGTSIFEKIFEKIVKNLNSQNTNMLDNLLDQLQNGDSNCDDTLNICIILVEYLSKDKRCKDYYNQYRIAILSKIRSFFTNKSIDGNKEKEFVLQTLSGFTTILSSTLSLSDNSEIDDSLRGIVDIFINYSVNCSNVSSVKLLNVVLTHKNVLSMSEDNIKLIIDKYWQHFITSLKNHSYTSDNSELFLKLIMNNKSTEELIEILTDGDNKITDNMSNFNSYQEKLFSGIAKCQLNKTKGSVFSECFKRTSFRILLGLKTDDDITKNVETILKLLQCQKQLVDNIQIPVSLELIDDILTLLTEINIKKYKITDDGLKDFVKLLTNMLELSLSLIQHRHFFIVDRIPQFVLVFKDLVQAICWYKSDRKKDDNLENGEVTMLADLSHKLENIIKSLVKHEKDVKRVAPYLLIFVINLMISNDRPTTLYPKIKNHIESICYDLISVCDHRVESFILRSCNEASKTIYEQMSKEYNNYHKFKGKI